MDLSENRTLDVPDLVTDALQLRYHQAPNIDTLMWPMVRMKHASAPKIQKSANFLKPLAQKTTTYLMFLIPLLLYNFIINSYSKHIKE